jgi:hypothetical protein
MPNKFNLVGLLKNFEAAKRIIPVVIAVETKNQFTDNFRTQSFDGKRWKEVKRRIQGTQEWKYPKTKSYQT